MRKENGSYEFNPEYGVEVGCTYVVKFSGPGLAKGHFISQDNVHWFPNRNGRLAYAQRIGRSSRQGRASRKLQPDDV
jgi:hypothetical protein